MQGKGLVMTFAIALGLLSLYYLSFTWFTNTKENQIENQVSYKMDSLTSSNTSLTLKDKQTFKNNFLQEAKQQVSKDTLDLFFASYDYNTAKDKEMSLGLDLKGGMNVILQISVRDLIEDYAGKKKDDALIAILDKTDQAQKSSSNNYIDDFFTEYYDAKSSQSNLQLTSPGFFGTRDNAEVLNVNTTDEEAEEIIRQYVDDKVNTAFQVIRARIDQFGVTQPVVQRVGEKGGGRILVELPGVKETNRVSSLLQSTAKLEFFEAVPFNESINGYFQTLNQRLLSSVDSTRVLQYNLTGILQPSQTNAAYFVKISDTAIVNRALNSPLSKSVKPANLRFTKFLWGNKLYRERNGNVTDMLPLYAIKTTEGGDPLMDGATVTTASSEQRTQTIGNEVVVSMQMNSQGAKQWFDITKEYTGRPIAIVLDNMVYSAPNINEPIPGGQSVISGDFTINEGKDLASVLAAGSLPASADIIQADVVGPSLGKEAIQSGLLSFIVALLLVFVYMIFFYARAGIVSVIALIANLLFLFGILVSFGAVLTLPGIAGIVLTIGMAVDANVIIYERIKEELFAGKSMKEAVDVAYSWKGAISAIVDANITTLLTAIVLFYFGDGPVKGFAVTLMIGIFTSIFSSVLLSKVMIYDRVEEGKKMTFGNKLTLPFLKGSNVDFLKYKKYAYIFSSAIILIALGSLLTRGLNLGIEFQNGREYKVRFNQEVEAGEIASSLATVFIDENNKQYTPKVVTIGTNNQVKITTKYKASEEGAEIDSEIEDKLFTALKPYLPTDLDFKEFVNVGADASGEALGLVEYRKVGPSIADDITTNSFYSVAIALALVFIYLLIRFRKWQFSAGAVIAVFHDALFVLGMFSLLYGILPFSLEIDVAFIAAILTVIGYSINDTVIVFDRIREFMYEHPKMPFGQLINKAINTTLTRTVNTSLTTLFVILVIFIFGGETIRGFMFALLVGIGIGTYSSVFVASFLTYDLAKGSLKNREA